MWQIEYGSDWEKYFEKLDLELRRIVVKRIEDIRNDKRKYKHLKFGVPFFKDEFNDQKCRICFTEHIEKNTRVLCFVGDHKDYEKWLGIKG